VLTDPVKPCDRLQLKPVTGSSYWTVLDDRELWQSVIQSILLVD